MRSEDSTEAARQRPAPPDHANRADPVVSAAAPSEPGPAVVLDRRKNRIVLHADRVQKTFKPGRQAERNHRRELAALALLHGVEGVPEVLDVDAEKRTVVLSRVPGRPMTDLEAVQDSSLVDLRRLVEAILERGVARHSLPARDVLVAPDGSVGLVDFERTTCRRFPCDPIFSIAKVVMRFHAARLVHGRAPHLLTGAERRRLGLLLGLRAALQIPRHLKRRIRQMIRNA